MSSWLGKAEWKENKYLWQVWGQDKVQTINKRTSLSKEGPRVFVF